MYSAIAFSCFLVAASASPQLLAPVFAPTVTQQYHAQDELGQYTYGYSGGPSAKEETRTVDGVTRGSYSYIDGHGLVQSASYVSDPVNGFRVAATNLPVGPSAPAAAIAPATVIAAAPVAVAATPAYIPDTPEVAAAKVAHFAAHHEAVARLGRKRRSIALAPYAIAPAARFAYSSVAAHPYAYAAPLHAPILAAAPLHSQVVAATPVVATKSQYHAQDELGQYSYGYSDALSSKQESRRADGVTTGGYSYLDANGIVQSVNYVADPVNGFRVAATNLPVGPA